MNSRQSKTTQSQPMELPENKPDGDTLVPQAPEAADRFEIPRPNPASSSSLSPETESVIGETGRETSFSVLPDFQPQHRKLLRIGMGILLTVLAIEWILIATERPDPMLIQRGEAFQRQFRIEINSATWVEWLQMEGIGQSLAHRIVADRKLNGPFQSIDDVSRVPGIGPATLDRIRPWLTIHHDPSETQSNNAAQSPNSQSSGEHRSFDGTSAGPSQRKPAANQRKSATF